jgi:hypothetical protein
MSCEKHEKRFTDFILTEKLKLGKRYSLYEVPVIMNIINEEGTKEIKYANNAKE